MVPTDAKTKNPPRSEAVVSPRLTPQDALDVIFYLKAYSGETQRRTSPLDLADKIREFLVASL